MPKEQEHIYDKAYQGIIDDFILDHNLGDLIKEDNLIDSITGQAYHLTSQDIEHVVAHYDAAINYMDKQIGYLLAELGRLGLEDKTVIIFFGDHGEELMDRGGRILKRKHGDAYEEGIHVPLIIKHPGIKPEERRRIGQQVQLIDISPTILDFLGIPVSRTMQGKSLLSLMENKGKGRDIYAFSGTYNKDEPDAFAEYMAIRTQEWKLIHVFDAQKDSVTFELYNIKDDPKEAHDVKNDYPKVVSSLKGHLLKWYELSRGFSSLDRVDLGIYGKMRQNMKDFGYWWVEKKPDVQERTEMPPNTDE